MEQRQLTFRVDIGRVCDRISGHVSGDYVVDDANANLRAVSKLDPRPVRAVFDDGYVEMNLVIAAESLSEAHGQQSRSHDSLTRVLNDAKLGRDYAIEYDPPEEVEAGTKAHEHNPRNLRGWGLPPP